MSNIYNEQRAEQMFEEMKEDNISKESLVEVLDFIKKYLPHLSQAFAVRAYSASPITARRRCPKDHCESAEALQLVLQAVPRRREQAAMEALSGSASLDDFVAKIEATDWAGCDARAFARAVTVKLVTLSKSEKYVRPAPRD